MFYKSHKIVDAWGGRRWYPAEVMPAPHMWSSTKELGWSRMMVQHWEGIWEGQLDFAGWPRYFWHLTLNWPGLKPPCDVGESSVPLQIPASDRKTIPFLIKHHYWYCKPLPLGNHPHPDEDRAVPGKNRSPECAWAHSSLPELLASCSPVSMYSERTEEQEGGGITQGRAALSYSQSLSGGIRKDKPTLPETPCCEWQLDALYQEPEWAAAATAETTHLQNVRVGDFFEELQVCKKMKEKSDFFFLLKAPGLRETQVGNYLWNCYFHLRALHWSHSQMEITSFFKENGHTV